MKLPGNVMRPWRVLSFRCLIIGGCAALAACGGGGSGDAPPHGGPGGGSSDNGSDAPQATVPNLVGLGELEATSSLTAAGFVVGIVKRFGTVTAPETVVISQAPTAGSDVSVGTKINFSVAPDAIGGSSPIQLTTGYVPRCGAFSESSAPIGGTRYLGSQAGVGAWIETTYEVASAVAAAAGRETTLQVGQSPQCPRRVAGTLNLSGVPSGPIRVNVRVVDTRGNFAEVSYGAVLDRYPELTVVEPRNGTVGLGTLPVDVRCTDDQPDCELQVILGGIDVLTGVGAIARTLDLTAYVGHCTIPLVSARDSVGQTSSQSLSPVCIENPARVSVAQQVPGVITDVDATRILFYEQTTAGEALSIYARASGVTERLPLPNGWARVDARPARLTTPGAIIELLPTTVPDHHHVHFARLGALTDVGRATSYVSVSGRYAVWSEERNLYRLDAATGLPELILSTGAEGPSVTDDGTVVFTDSNSQLVRWRAGRQIPLTTDANWLHINPVAVGDDVVYLRASPLRWGEAAVSFIHATAPPIRLSLRSAPDPTNPPSGWPPEHGPGYQLSGGWVAYVDFSASNVLQIYTRSPQGTFAQRTDLATSHRIDRLAPNGELMTFANDRRYFSRPGGVPAEIGSAFGKSYYIDGVWYVAIHGTLLSVDTNAP